jgi:general secretion pathway protein F
VALIVVILLLVAIVPRISEQFDTMGLQLPLITRFMIGLSQFLQGAWPVLAGLAVAGVLGYAVAMRQEPVRRAVHRARLSTPLLSGLQKKVEAARFARTMGILVASGAVLPDALRAARRASGDLVVQDVLKGVIEQVETGKGLADALRAARFFPPIMVYMIAAGERSGRLAEMFERAAEHLEGDVDGLVTAGLSLLEPGIILVMAAIVVTIVLSILLPILQLNTSVLT